MSTDRQLSALQTAVTMLRALPEQKSLIYFSSGLRLNGVDNQAQLRATTNAAIRANVALHPIDARGLVAQAPLGDATRPSPGGIGTFSGQLAQNAITAFQRSQDTLFSLAKDTGGRALFDSTIGAGHRAGGRLGHELLHHRLLQPASGQRRPLPPRARRRWLPAAPAISPTARGISPTRSSRSSRRRTRSVSSRTR